MDFASRILQIAEETVTANPKVETGDVASALVVYYRALDPENQPGFREAVVNLLDETEMDSCLLQELFWLCNRLELDEAAPRLMEMLRNAESASAMDTVPVGLSRAGVQRAAALLTLIVIRGFASPPASMAAHLVHHQCLGALARGCPIAVVPFLRPLFEDNMKRGFKSWQAGPESYRYGGAQLPSLVAKVLREYGVDGVELVKDTFTGIPTQWEAYLRAALEEALRILGDPHYGELVAPPLLSDIAGTLNNYMGLLGSTTEYITPATPPWPEDK